jgi:hypothetical protein
MQNLKIIWAAMPKPVKVIAVGGVAAILVLIVVSL